MSTWEGRHLSVREKCEWLEPNPALPPGPPATVASMFKDAKDCTVRQAIADSRR